MALETGQLVDRHRAPAKATPVLRRDLMRTRSVAHNNMIRGELDPENIQYTRIFQGSLIHPLVKPHPLSLSALLSIRAGEDTGRGSTLCESQRTSSIKCLPDTAVEELLWVKAWIVK